MIRPVAERERHRANRRRVQIRRRRAAVAAAAAVALVAGVAVGAGGGGDEPGSPPAGEEGRTVPEESPEEAVDRLSLEQQVGRMVILRFAGTEAPRYVLDVLGEGRAAGAILFRDNVVDPDQLRRLTRSLRRAAPGVLVCVDQEGGAIRIVPWAPPERAAPEQQAFGAVREDSEAAGRPRSSTSPASAGRRSTPTRGRPRSTARAASSTRTWRRSRTRSRPGPS